MYYGNLMQLSIMAFMNLRLIQKPISIMQLSIMAFYNLSYRGCTILPSASTDILYTEIVSVNQEKPSHLQSLLADGSINGGLGHPCVISFH